MSQFPLYAKPYQLAFIDDDVDFIELMKMAIGQHWQAHFFNQSNSFIEFIDQQIKLNTNDFIQFSNALNNNDNATNSIQSIINYWNSNPDRHSLVEVAILDFAMPKMTGIEILQAIPQWHGLNILLTGVANETLAVKAFNEGLIQRFLPKQSEDVIASLVAGIKQLEGKLFSRYQQACDLALTQIQRDLIKDSSCQEFLITFAAQHWKEYVVLSEPFGILGLSKSEQLSWLQLEKSDEIADLVQIALLESWDPQSLELIKTEQVLANSLLRQSLNNAITPSVSPVVKIGNNGLIGAFFEFIQ